METSKKYKEIHKLKKMLEDTDIPFDWIEGWGYDEKETEKLRKIAPDLMERYQICCPEGSFNHCDNRWISVIEGFGTYGAEQDRLEIMGGLTEEEKEEGYEVIGWLTAEEVFERIKKLEEENEKSN